MSAKHTPGPWTQDPEGEIAVSIEGPDGIVICDVYGAANSDTREANARLIISAPELLAALEAIIANAGKTRMAHLDADLPQDRALIQACAAIAKAKGK